MDGSMPTVETAGSFAARISTEVDHDKDRDRDRDREVSACNFSTEG